MQLSSDDLLHHIQSLSDILTFPWFANSTFISFKNAVSGLTECLNKYHQFLTAQKTRTVAVHHSEEPVRSLKDNWVLNNIDGGPEIKIKSCYIKLHEKLQNMEIYQPLALAEFEPELVNDRRHWYDKIQLPYPVTLYVYRHGNYCGNVCFIWRRPVNKDEENDSQVVKIVADINSSIKVYGTRQLVKDLTHPFVHSLKIKPAVMRNLVEFIKPNFSVPHDHSSDAEISERLLDMLLDSDDTELIYDLRANNGRPSDSRFDPFWEELKRYLDEVSAVHERRQDSTMYLPLAISVTDLIRIIKERLPDGSIVPSESTVRLQFWPTNAYAATALKYTGRYNVRYAIQQRQIRAQHPDQHYCAFQYHLLKHFAVLHREYVEFLSEDDKAIVPIGEPGKAVSAVQRNTKKSLTPRNEPSLLSLDHDFHVFGLVPSVILQIDVPGNVADSFYHGQPHVIVKDKVFEPSSALRHATEAVKVLRSVASSDDVSLTKPILVQYTDGGPDHRSTFKSVQLAHVATFIALDLDLLVSARTAPYQSYRNPAERIMADLNMALQNTSFAREPLEGSLEHRMRSLTSLKAVRRAAASSGPLRDGLIAACAPAKDAIKQRFQRLHRNSVNFQVHDAAQTEDFDRLVDVLKVIEPEIQSSDVEKAVDMKKWPRLKEWMDFHCRLGHYMVQVSENGCAALQV